jgi:hypothetical protein
VIAAPHPYLFAQTSLDSGALTLLGTVVHQFTEPGEYRGISVGQGGVSSVFYLTVTKEPGITQVNIDLAALAGTPVASSGCTCGMMHGTPSQGHFTLGSHGYAVFHVSGGPGGYAVRLGRAATAPQAKDFDSTTLKGGDVFAATILRPGRYNVHNAAQAGAKPGELQVAFPPIGKTAYQPPPPLRVKLTEAGFHEPSMHLTAMQGCVFVCEVPSRIKIDLVSALDPPS